MKCPDGGKCHHKCNVNKCWRVTHCVPLSGVFADDRWPAEVKRVHAQDPPRRGISLKGTTYARLKLYAQRVGAPMGTLVKEWVEEALSKADVPMPDEVEAPKPRRKHESDIHGGGVHEF